MLSREDRDVAASFKDRLVADGVPIHQVVAFGSRARGDANEDSDLDLLVIVERLDANIRRVVSHAAWEIGFEAGVLIQAIVLTRAAVETGPERSSLLLLAVREEGVPV